MFSRYSIVIAAAVLGAAAVGSALLLSDLKLRVEYSDNQIQVAGRVSEVVPADCATFCYTLTQSRPTAAEAYTALMVAQTQIRVKMLNLGFAKENLISLPVSVTTEMKRTENGSVSNEVLKVNASVATRVVSRDPALAAANYRQPEAWMAQGVSVSTTIPEYTLDDPDQYCAKLLAPATAAAREQARAVAEKSARKLGRMLSAFPACDCEPVPDKPGFLKLTVTVNASFEIR